MLSPSGTAHRSWRRSWHNASAFIFSAVLRAQVHEILVSFKLRDRKGSYVVRLLVNLIRTRKGELQELKTSSTQSCRLSLSAQCRWFGVLRSGIAMLLGTLRSGTYPLTSSSLASAQSSNGHSPHTIAPVLLRQTTMLPPSNAVCTPSIIISRHLSWVLSTPRDNILTALARSSHWWDFSIFIAKLRLHRSQTVAPEHRLLFPFAKVRNRLAAYAISVSGVQLSRTIDKRSCVPDTSYTPQVACVRIASRSGTDVSFFPANGG